MSAEGWVVDADPRLKIIGIINFSSMQMFFTAFALCIVRLFKLKTESQTVYSKPHCKVTKLKIKIFAYPGLT